MAAQVVELRGDAAGYIREIQRAQRQVEKFKEDNKGLKKAGAEMGKALEEGAKKSAAELGKLGDRIAALEGKLEATTAAAGEYKTKNDALNVSLRTSKTRNEELDRALRKVTADYEKQHAANMNQARDLDLLALKTKKVGTEAVAAGAAGSKGFGGMVTSVKSLVGGLIGAGGVLGALALVKAELEDLEAREAAKKNMALTVESAEANIASNMAATDSKEWDAAATEGVVLQGRKIAGNKNVPVLDIQNAIAEGLSASGGDAGATLSAVELMAELNRARPGDIAPGTTGLLNVMRIMGTGDAEVAQGQLELIGANSAIADPAKIATTAPRALAAGASYGYDVGETGAFFSTLTREGTDSQGDRSASAAIAFTEQLFEFFNKVGEGKLDTGGGVALNKAATAERGYGLGFNEQIAALQGNAKLGEEFLAGMSVENFARAPIRNLVLDMESSFANSLEEIAARGPLDDASLRAQVDSRRVRLDAVPSTAIGDVQRAVDSDQEQAKLAGATPGQVYSKAELDETLSGSGVSYADRTIAGVGYFGRRALGQSSEEAYGNSLAAQRDSFAASDPEGTRSAGTEGTNAEVAGRLSAALDKQYQVLAEIARNTAQRGEVAPAARDVGVERVPVRGAGGE